MRAVIWTPTGSREDLAACMAVAQAQRWPVEAVIHRWEDWVALVRDDRVDVGIMPDRDVLPATRTPRLATVAELQPPLVPPPGTHRPSWLRSRRPH